MTAPTLDHRTATVPENAILFREDLQPGASWSWRLRRGTTLRLTTTGANANVACLAYNAEQPLERYNMADSLKAQHTAHLTAGHACYSDMGRVLLSIPADDCGWHDPISGLTDAAMIARRYGETSYQDVRNARYRNGRDNMLIELGKHGLGKKDLVPVINWFSKVVVDAEGRMTRSADHTHGDESIDLRADMDVLVVLSNTPHPLDTGNDYRPPAIAMTLWRSGPAGPDDLCRKNCDENQRGFELTDRYAMR